MEHDTRVDARRAHANVCPTARGFVARVDACRLALDAPHFTLDAHVFPGLYLSIEEWTVTRSGSPSCLLKHPPVDPHL